MFPPSGLDYINLSELNEIEGVTRPAVMTDRCEYEPVENGEGKKKVEAMEEEKDGVGLKASLGLVQGCTIIVGSIIGSGIFIAPGGVLKQTGSVNMSLAIWVLSGLYSMVGAYCYAELGLLIRKVRQHFS